MPARLLPVVLALSLLVALARAQDADPARGVAPESLAQGFVIVVDDHSGLADDQTPIYLASNHAGWNPGVPAMRLVRGSDGLWRIELPRPTRDEPMRFKFTLGDWSRVERDASGQDIENRVLPMIDPATLAPGQRPMLRFSVESFREPDPAERPSREIDPYRTLDVSGDVRRLQVSSGAGAGAGATRDVLIWLPPGYDDPHNAQRRYPVLYLHDGQNVFEKLPGVFGEWRADETATELISRAEIEPIVIVAIPHAGPARAQEYLPVRVWDDVEPAGDAYVGWLFSEVMPRVERAFRVRTDREGVAIGGASLGAVISIHAHAMNPARFGALLLESTPTLANAADAWQERLDAIESWPLRVFIGVGGREVGSDERDAALNRAYVELSQRLRDAIERTSSASVRFELGTTDTHNEDAWARRLPEALRFLFPPR